MSALRLCAIIPTHNHVDALDGILSALSSRVEAIIVTDDGSTPERGARIRAVCEHYANVEYQRHAFNGGKGFAVLCGLARAHERGFTHALQVDADGQHDLSSVDAMIAMAERNPDAIVTGTPQFDTSIPFHRRFWRGFTTFWVRINTLSTAIRDAMCGFRIYPVPRTLEIARQSVQGRRMDFDVEILVKAHWSGVAMAPVPVRVTYPAENFSNFQIVRDNVLLSLMQTRLFFGMLPRLPSLLLRRRPRIRQPDDQPTKWADMRERGAYWGLRVLAGVYRIFGRTLCLGAMAPVILYFFATGHEQRKASLDYLQHLWKSGLLREKPTLWMSFRHFMSFGAASLDKLAAWTGDIPEAQVLGNAPQLLHDVETSGRGAFVITAHIGSPEVIRAVAVLGDHVPINVLMHIEHAEMFNRLIREFSPDSPVRAFPVTKIGVDTAMLLSEAIARGEWVVMVGDRIPVSQGGRVVHVPFLGDLAPFPQGPYVLGALLKASTYLMFCVRGKRGFDVHFSKFADPVVLPRRDRDGAIRSYAAAFAKALEVRVADTPLQWFNFFSFWSGQDEQQQAVHVAQEAAE
jgi:predicted LPLAT superfamily acyltransferase